MLHSGRVRLAALQLLTAAFGATAAPPKAPPPEPPVGGPGAAVISGVDRAFFGQPITLHGTGFARAGEPVVFIGLSGFAVKAKIVGAYQDTSVTVEIPPDLWIPDKEGHYFAQVQTGDPPVRSYLFEFNYTRDPCTSVPGKDKAACARARAGQGACAGKSADEMPRCLSRQPDPGWDAECAGMPANQQAQCRAEVTAFKECIHIKDVEKADGCFSAVIRRELGR